MKVLAILEQQGGQWHRMSLETLAAAQQIGTEVEVAVAGADVWVTNQGTSGSTGNSITEVSANDGSLVQTVSGSSYGFDAPFGITYDGSDLWVTNVFGNSVTEVAASGSLVRTLSGGSYGFVEPTFVAFDGSDVWVTNQSAKSVTEVRAGDGSWVNTYS